MTADWLVYRPSPRQMQVLRLVAMGQTNPQIGEQLGIKPSTVSYYVSEIRIGLGARDRADIVTQARQIGVLTPEST